MIVCYHFASVGVVAGKDYLAGLNKRALPPLIFDLRHPIVALDIPCALTLLTLAKYSQ
jgi:hypothetical protein